MNLIDHIEKTMLVEMALRKDLLDLKKVIATAKAIEAAGIDLSKYTLAEISAAFFLFFDAQGDENLETPAGKKEHAENVMKKWKPGVGGGKADWNYRFIKEKYTDLMKHGIEASKVAAVELQRSRTMANKGKESLDVARFEKAGVLKLKKKEEEDDE